MNAYALKKKTVLLTKRHYTNKDVILDHFGRLHHLPAQLVENGFTVEVICANYRNKKEEFFSYSGVNFHSIPLALCNSIVFLHKIWKYIYRYNPDFIITSGDSHFGFIGLVFSKLLGIPCVFDIYDDYTVFKGNKLPFMKSFFKWSARYSDAVICASSPLKAKISKYNKNIAIIENGVDEQLFRPIRKSEARARLGISCHEPVIGYCGSIGKNYGINILSDAVFKLREEIPGVKLLIAGNNRANICLSHPHIDYRGVVPQDEVPFFINAVDVAVIPYLPTAQINVSSPCKLPEYLACGVLIVSTRVSDIPNTLSDTPEALCKPGDREDMARAIRWQLENRVAVPLPEYLRWKSLGEKLKDLLNELAAIPH
jgi:glycosyltransferase involved in cell wall biosynthesis